MCTMSDQFDVRFNILDSLMARFKAKLWAIQILSVIKKLVLFSSIFYTFKRTPTRNSLITHNIIIRDNFSRRGLKQ